MHSVTNGNGEEVFFTAVPAGVVLTVGDTQELITNTNQLLKLIRGEIPGRITTGHMVIEHQDGGGSLRERGYVYIVVFDEYGKLFRPSFLSEDLASELQWELDISSQKMRIAQAARLGIGASCGQSRKDGFQARTAREALEIAWMLGHHVEGEVPEGALILRTAQWQQTPVLERATAGVKAEPSEEIRMVDPPWETWRTAPECMIDGPDGTRERARRMDATTWVVPGSGATLDESAVSGKNPKAVGEEVPG